MIFKLKYIIKKLLKRMKSFFIKVTNRFFENLHKFLGVLLVFSWRRMPRTSSIFLKYLFPIAIPKLSKNLEFYGDFETILPLLARESLKKNPTTELLVTQSRCLIKLSRDDALEAWYRKHVQSFWDTPLSLHDRQLRSAVLRVGERLKIQELRVRLLKRALIDFESRDEDISEIARKFLLENRVFHPIQEKFFRPKEVFKWSTVKQGMLTQSSETDLKRFFDLASLNESREPEDRMLSISDARRADALELFIPPHFFATWDKKSGGARKSNWSDIREIYRNLITAAETLKIPMQPRHQYFLNYSLPSGTMPSLSFFSHGGSRLDWHIRDVGIHGRISIDPDGYWGHSALSKVNITDQLGALDVPEVHIADAVSVISDWFKESGGNKYSLDNKSVDQSGDLDLSKAIFVPLQAPNGLEATSHRVEELISLVSDYSRKTGAKVLLRRHPLDVSALVTSAIHHATKNSNCVLSDLPPWVLASQTMATVSLNSATVLQSIAAGKPVFTWGSSDVHSVSTDIGDLATFCSNMEKLEVEEATRKQLQARFCYVYLKRYLINVNDQEQVRERLNLIHSLSKLDTSAEIRQAFVNSLF